VNEGPIPFPFQIESFSAWNHFKRVWKSYIGAILSLTSFLRLLVIIPSIGMIISICIGTPIAYIFYVGFFRKYRADRKNETLTLGTLIDQLGTEWRAILMANLACFTRIFAAGYWTIYPLFAMAGRLILTDQALAYDRSGHWNANEVSETMLDTKDGLRLFGIFTAYIFIIFLFNFIISMIFSPPIAAVITTISQSFFTLFLLIFKFEIWEARLPLAESAPLAANHQWDWREYWMDVKKFTPRALGTLAVIFVGFGIIGVSAIETLIHLFH
jgi:hypothetical protein